MKLLLVFALVALSFLAQILVMINGWGLAPADWLWIIAGGLASFIFGVIGMAIGNLN